MTPQETQLVDELFDRLAKLENTPRDAAAERLIAAGAQRAPHGLYALVQTALLQDEALKRANARIEEMQAELDGPQEGNQEPERPQPSFLDSMREAFGGQRREARGSVPNVRAQNAQSQGDPRPDYPPQPPPPGNPPGAAMGSGGSFLGTAASAAAGAVGGALLLDGIRSMFGHHPGGHGSSAFGNVSEARAAHGSDPARELGIDHVGDHHAHEAREHAGKAGADAQNVADDEEQDRNDDDDYDDDDDNGDDDDDDDDDDNGDGSDDSDDV